MTIGDTVLVLVGLFAGHEDIIEAIIPLSEDMPLERYDVRGTSHRWYFAEEIAHVVPSTITSTSEVQ